MKKQTLVIACLSGSLLLASCGLSNSVKGAGIGTVAGAGLGAVIGKVSGNTGLGAAIGAAVGGTAGAIIGNKMDKQKKELEKTVEGAKIETINNGQAIRVTFDSGLLFSTGKADLSEKSRQALKNFATSANNNAMTNIQIIGHTDNTGSDKINNPLSERRAESVYNFLRNEGVAASRMTYKGEGSYNPVADNNTAAGRQENRRVEVYIIPSQEMIDAAQNGQLK